jgi:hypothetical protein
VRHLLRAELLRLRLRRAVLLLLAAALLVPAIIFGATVYATRPVSASELKEAQASIDRDVASGTYTGDIARCVRHPDRYGVGVTDVQQGCETAVLPRVEYYVYRGDLDLREQRESGTGIAVVLVLSVLLLLVGTTFVGHDWNSGSMSNQLLFEPRRDRIWFAKAAVVLGVGLVLALAVLILYWSGLWAVASSRSTDIAPHAVEAAYKQAVLGAVFAALSGVAGFALTMLFRSTVATLGLLLALSAVGAVVVGSLGLGNHFRLQPTANLAAYLVGSFTDTSYGSPGCPDPSGPINRAQDLPDCSTRIDRSDATIYWSGVFLLTAVPSLLVFRRRDVP